MKCPECGNEINDNAKFCIYCGKVIEDNIPVPEISGEIYVEEPPCIICPGCGKKMQANKAFCTNCGNPLNGSFTEENGTGKEKANKPKRKSLKVIICLVVLLIIIVDVIATIHFIRSNDSKSDIDAEVVEKEDEDESEEVEDERDSQDEEEEDSSTEKKETEPEVDVDPEITEIRKIYDTIASGMENNAYKQQIIEDGFVTYSDNNSLKSIVVSKDYSGINYDCFYYFDNDKLIYAYYKGTNSHRFYFKNDKMIRWEDCEDEEVTNHDREDTAEYLQWESTVQQNAKKLKLAWNAAGPLEGDAEYILPGSDTRIITNSDLDGLTKEEVKLARNEIYARHGRKFDDEYLQAYFSQFAWYHPTIEPKDFQESMLNVYEVANRDFIVEYEKEKGYR